MCYESSESCPHQQGGSVVTGITSPLGFQNLMNKVLNGLHFTLAYLDDVIIFSKSAKQHLKHIQKVLTRLKQAKLHLKKSKSLFFKHKLHYLGHLLTKKGIKPQSEKVKAISEMKLPRNLKGVREFLRMVDYYRKFINRFANPAQTHDKADKERCQVWMDRGMSDWIWVPEDMSNWGPNPKVSWPI